MCMELGAGNYFGMLWKKNDDDATKYNSVIQKCIYLQHEEK